MNKTHKDTIYSKIADKHELLQKFFCLLRNKYILGIIAILIVMAGIYFFFPFSMKNNSLYDIQTFERDISKKDHYSLVLLQDNQKYYSIKNLQNNPNNVIVSLKLVKQDGEKSRVYQSLNETPISSIDARTISIPTNLPVGKYSILVFEKLSAEDQNKLIINFDEVKKESTASLDFEIKE